MERSGLSERGRRALAAAAIVIFIGFFVLCFFLVGRPMVRFASEPEKFRAWIDAFGAWGKLAFVGMMTLQVVVAIIPGEALELGAGYAFGAVEGLVLCQAGVAIGTALVFLFVRRFGVRALEVFFSVERINSMKYLRDTKRLYLLSAIVFFIPGTPKDLITYFMGLTNMKLLPLLAISVVARIPSVITSTLSGSALGEENYTLAAVVLAGTLAISGLGILIYRRITRTGGGGKDK